MRENNDSVAETSRRAVLKRTGVVAATAGAFAGAASAKGNGNGNAGGRGGTRGRPFLEPTHDGIVFCGCSQVCVCVLPGECGTGTVRLRNGDCVEICEGECYEGDGIVAVGSEDASGGTIRTCNPNAACSGNDPSACDEVGTAPQFGEKCGEAYLRDRGYL